MYDDQSVEAQFDGDLTEGPVTFLEILVDQWLSRLEAARRAKEDFDHVAQTCYDFYKNSARFMWEDDWRKKHIGNIEKPKFEITIAKAFEYVAIFGPYLFWDYPYRECRAHEPLTFEIDVFGDPNNPEIQAFYQESTARDAQDLAARNARCKLMSAYLNYSQREQPQGLALHARLAIQDALIKGRGLLVPREYSFEGSERTLTGLFYENVDNLFIDADCHDPLLETAAFIAIRHVDSVNDVEDRFRFRRGTLEGHGNLETSMSLTVNNRQVDKMHRQMGETQDLIVWYEIWSKCGVGERQRGVKSNIHDALDDVVGKHAYLCVAPSVPFFLNAPPESFTQNTTDDDVRSMMMWPFPCQTDNRWPIAILDFYRDSQGAWPVAPLGSALGELICINVLTAAFVERAYGNRKLIIAAMESALKDVDDAIKSDASPAYVKIKEDVADTIDKVIQYLQPPAMNKEILEALSWVMELFEKRTGLVDFMYGVQHKISRSATDIKSREEKTSIRPEQMSRDVAAFITEASELEKFLATWVVTGQDLEPLLGKTASMLWDILISREDPEVVVREMHAYVEATDVRRPNRERDMGNLQQMLGWVLPVLQAYSEATGETTQLNEFIQAIGTAMEQDVDGWELNQWVPQQDPQMAQLQQRGAELEVEKLDAEVKKITAEAMRAIAQSQGDQTAAEQRQLELGFEEIERERQLDFDEDKHEQEMEQDRQKFLLDLAQTKTLGKVKVEQMRAESRARAAATRASATRAGNGKA